MPAMLRGFFDKVMLEGSAYTADENGMHPVRQIEHTFLFTTSSATTEALIHDFGDPVHGTIIDATFKALGFKNAKWHNLGNITEVGEKEATAYLASLKDRI